MYTSENAENILYWLLSSVNKLLLKIAPDELVGTLHGSQSPLVCECVCERVNERHKLYSALDKGAI